MADKKPNSVFFHVDNLGMGELGCYGGGILRGADTKRTDQFRTEGTKLTHYVVEPQCTPTRSALMTGRYPIRSGNHTIALGGNAGGLVRGDHRRRDPGQGRIRLVMPRQVAHRRGGWALADRSRLRRVVRAAAHLRRMHVARRSAVRGGARRLLVHALGPQGRGRKADQVPAAHR